jgi:hypothetical protein
MLARSASYCRAGIRQRPASWRAAAAGAQSTAQLSSRREQVFVDEWAGEKPDKKVKGPKKPQWKPSQLHEFFIRKFDTSTLIEDDGADPISEDSVVGRWNRQINRSLRKFVPASERSSPEAAHGEQPNVQQPSRAVSADDEPTAIADRAALAVATPLNPAAFSFQDGGVWLDAEVRAAHAARTASGAFFPAVSTFNNQLLNAARVGDAKAAAALLQRLEIHRLSPDEAGYTYALCALAKRGAWAECLRLHAEMVARGFAPASTASNAAIAACCTTGNWRRALPVLGYMRRAAAPPALAEATAAARDAALAAAAVPDNYAAAEAAAAAARAVAAAAAVAKAAAPTLLSYAALVAAAHAEGDLASVDTIYEEGVLRGALQHWSDDQDDEDSLELHGFDIPRAYAALRMVLRDASFVDPNLEAAPPSGDRTVFRPEQQQPLRVMLGRGTGALRAAVAKWCRHTQPAIRWELDPVNKGRMLLAAWDVGEWCLQNRVRAGRERPTDRVRLNSAYAQKQARLAATAAAKNGWVGVGKYGVAS